MSLTGLTDGTAIARVGIVEVQKLGPVVELRNLVDLQLAHLSELVVLVLKGLPRVAWQLGQLVVELANARVLRRQVVGFEVVDVVHTPLYLLF